MNCRLLTIVSVAVAASGHAPAQSPLNVDLLEIELDNELRMVGGFVSVNGPRSEIPPDVELRLVAPSGEALDFEFSSSPTSTNAFAPPLDQFTGFVPPDGGVGRYVVFADEPGSEPVEIFGVETPAALGAFDPIGLDTASVRELESLATAFDPSATFDLRLEIDADFLAAQSVAQQTIGVVLSTAPMNSGGPRVGLNVYTPDADGRFSVPASDLLGGAREPFSPLPDGTDLSRLRFDVVSESIFDSEGSDASPLVRFRQRSSSTVFFTVVPTPGAGVLVIAGVAPLARRCRSSKR